MKCKMFLLMIMTGPNGMQAIQDSNLHVVLFDSSSNIDDLENKNCISIGWGRINYGKGFKKTTWLYCFIKSLLILGGETVDKLKDRLNELKSS